MARLECEGQQQGIDPHIHDPLSVLRSTRTGSSRRAMRQLPSPMCIISAALPAKSMVNISVKFACPANACIRQTAAALVTSPSPPKP